ncbi:MAG: ATP-binding protein [Paenibacillus sp.]|jgi:energy-coupling factor transporter ATP-binding protein EcfA2|nr:ATP-binding protein [Paenibacillus sp.]
MQLHEKVTQGELTSFVGRTKELEMMFNHINSRWKWQWLHIYGPSGIGKSTLLKHFKSYCTDNYIYELDGSRGLIEADVKDIAERISQHSHSTESTIVLLIDSFDQWRSAEYWLARWLGQLRSTVRIITAGQNYLTGGWLRSGWASLIQMIQLKTLSPSEVSHYAQKRGIADLNASSLLFRYSRGIPLAMMLATEVMLRGDDFKLFDSNKQFYLTSMLMNELLQNMPSSLHQLLEAASVYWRFNEERLAVITQGKITAEAFRQFVELSFVVSRDDGWTLHDAVRAWALEDLIRRKPQAYEQMRRKALEQILLEERMHPHLQHNMYIDKFSLHEHPIVRTICFSGHLDDLELRECRECDLPTILSLYVHYHHHAGPLPEEVPPMTQLIRSIWEADPSSFITIWKQDEILAAYGKIPLNHRMLRVLENEPLLQPFIHGFERIPNAFLIAFVGIIPDLAENTRAYILNAILNNFIPSEWIIDFTCLTEWFPVFELVGFERAAWADAISPAGIEFRAFVLDLREEDFLTKLNRTLSSGPIERTLNNREGSVNINELKTLLKNWSRLPLQPDSVDNYMRLFPRRKAAIGDATGAAVQQDLLNSIQLLYEGGERESILGRLLTYTYIQVIEPHERVAERLNLSMATYYRHLNKALKQLYQLLANG